jgi:hypothetical protein
MLCPCTLGPAEPDQGWCSGALLFDVQQGDADNVNLSGCKVVLAVDLPGDFLSGNGIARLYIDEGAGADQRRELEAIFTGKKGGSFEMLNSLITKWLPMQIVRTEMAKDNMSAKIGTIGQFMWQPVKTEDGRQTTLQNAPVVVGFGVERSDLARGDGSQWSDPQMRRWQSGGHGTISAFALSA